ncbi:helix-turn-helix domain-containing protein, partial [Spongiactinospora gelatinilytica]
MVGERVELRRARRRLGMTQEEAAEALWVSMTTWSRWERGIQGVRPVYRARMAQVFDVPAAEIEHWLDGDTDYSSKAVETEIWPIPDFARLSVADTVEVAGRMWRCEVDPERRRMLAALPFAPAALDGWLSGWTYGTPAVAMHEHTTAPKVGLSDIRRVEEARQAFAQMDHRFGAGLVRPAIIDYLHTTVAPLLRGRYDERVGARLMTVAAGMTRLAGWTAFDLGHQGQAQRHYGQALKFAKIAGDALTGAWVLSAMSYQALYLSQASPAILLARAALDTARRADAPPRVVAWLLNREAWATALRANLSGAADTHETKRVERLLTEAERVYDRGPSDREPQWAAWYTPTEPTAEAARCWSLIGRHRRAAELLEGILPAYDQARSRSAQLTRISAAEAYLGMGELDHAIDSARTAVPATKTLSSTRL